MLFTKNGWNKKIIYILVVGATYALWQPNLKAGEAPTIIAAPIIDNQKLSGALQTTVLAGGCFWGVQGVFEHVKGVRKVVAGYAGGEKSSADYDKVSTGTTGHAESVQITFDPAEDYHQDFLINNPNYPYIVINDLPKIENLKQLFPKYYLGQPVKSK